MKKNLPIVAPNKYFDDIKKIDENGVEYWEARELMVLLDYGRWENFVKVIKKARKACTLSGQSVLDHFRDITKMIPTGKGAIRKAPDYKLSRYACYLIAQNGDSTKEPIALAQTYFATQTRKQEIYESLTDEQKRLLIRGDVIDHNKKLFKTAQDSGVRNFGKFNDAGYRGLYGLTAKEIQQKKQIGKDKILDRAGTTELAANLFRITQADEQLKSHLGGGETIGEARASNTHFVVGGKVRKAIKDIGGTMPEELPAEEHIEEIQKKIDRKKPLNIKEGMKKKSLHYKSRSNKE